MLRFGLRRRQLAGCGVMRAIAKWLVFGVPTATEADHGPAGKSKRFALLIHDFKVAFYTDISVVVDGDPGRGNSISEPQRAAHKANHSGTIYKERIPGRSEEHTSELQSH